MFSRLKNVAGQLRHRAGGRQAAAMPQGASPFGRLSFSQEGEDMILARIFEDKTDGFYLDVGAHHPQRFSNTYYFYLQGWRGINIDATPGSMADFNALRPNDINLEIAISDAKQVLTFYLFNEPALNGFSKDLAAQRDGLNNYKIISEQRLQTLTLAEVLDTYLPLNQAIDFLNVDVEGLDYEVLKSNDWARYRPHFVLVEDLQLSSLEHVNGSRVVSLLQAQKYELCCKTANTLIFRSNN